MSDKKEKAVMVGWAAHAAEPRDGEMTVACSSWSVLLQYLDKPGMERAAIAHGGIDIRPYFMLKEVDA